MKRICAVFLLLCIAFSFCTLTACKNDNGLGKNIYADLKEFDSYVPAGSDIVGIWKMTAPDTNKEWQFFDNTTLHQTTITGDVSRSTVCAYNYDGEGKLRVYLLDDKAEQVYSAVLEGSNLTLTDEKGVKLTFVKK